MEDRVATVDTVVLIELLKQGKSFIQICWCSLFGFSIIAKEAKGQKQLQDGRVESSFSMSRDDHLDAQFTFLE